ncbi:MBL fold metallo-hydrolase [Streptomyces glomeratus]|uniref:MBL fold metallo-hydrolase n=1 Tax=Streptomyces glomeratus TaxID=284452 RepID=A0ABP6LYS6_9ACTN|nr:MBL fold metallo-hydrolase [Streptomyces glomeratus]MCF1512162.1 MBL fold metallo-hydrolase [Streptomyces glomeratus]
MKRETNTPRKAAIAAVLAACSLGAPPTLASGSTPPPSVQETPNRVINAAGAPPTLAPGSTPPPSPQKEQKNPYDVLNAAAARDPITVTPLRGGVYLLQGSGGNIGVLPSKDGAFMVDAGIAVSRQKMESALNKLGATRIRYLVNTHWHFDHTGGNSWVHEHGAEIIATPNTLRNLSKTIRVAEWVHTFTPVPAAARPTVTVASEKTFTVGGQPVRLRPYSPAHTDGDLSADFTRADVLFTGDTFWNDLYPFIDHETGGSIDGTIRAANQNIAMVGDGTIVVPGHGPVGRRADLVEYRNMLVGIRNRVADLKGRGLTVEQTIAAKPTQPFDAKWGQGIIGPDLFTKLVYLGV